MRPHSIYMGKGASSRLPSTSTSDLERSFYTLHRNHDAAPSSSNFPGHRACSSSIDWGRKRFSGRALQGRQPANVLPTNGTLLGINFLPESLTAQVTNTSVGSGTAAGPSVSVASDTYSYCNLTVHYVHAGTEDRTIRLRFALPAPSEYKSRFYVGGEVATAFRATRREVSPTGLRRGPQMLVTTHSTNRSIRWYSWPTERWTGTQCACSRIRLLAR